MTGLNINENQMNCENSKKNNSANRQKKLNRNKDLKKYKIRSKLKPSEPKFKPICNNVNFSTNSFLNLSKNSKNSKQLETKKSYFKVKCHVMFNQMSLSHFCKREKRNSKKFAILRVNIVLRQLRNMRNSIYLLEVYHRLAEKLQKSNGNLLLVPKNQLSYYNSNSYSVRSRQRGDSRDCRKRHKDKNSLCNS